ncbi:hypothetical protein [Cellulomonas soli]|uniref:Uncharacterized protein n=1 Tax=Cellulomonas soli TaxID=931535 RepID=A0A512PAM5_9CELL|nr:hypothetical protein [Cellulomonas soli]NYI60738.1 hypothetical protein [Cellulomonas soli]GEP68254.1 hypothetical protein CSO01_09690 [Cellulomonas soli]
MKPAQSRASVSIGTSLPAPRVLELAKLAARQVTDPDRRLRAEDRTSSAVDLIVRPLGEKTEILRFDVQVDRGGGRTTARTSIVDFGVDTGGVRALVPPVRRKIIGFAMYRTYMQQLASAVQNEDPMAIVTVMTGD